ncbi:bacterioferritin-associated ferredoxin [Streptomyces sp. 1114.5]|uniref:(2Fe-2S)-binding protein n=1 Tax=unclassified Streptomyces TaxID=2593676 RepID=UPI000BD56A2F|nr:MULTISPECIES: (2Fe-2S)-binding protein [unclassified Streptomyces]RKT18374.1 bacterioferritin-associated ferredoxin [Streptomyces sp. 1114.5]SOB84569.1 Bacterioferritin-associated ferredoxin [Streptomyces sp. 1331.2]
MYVCMCHAVTEDQVKKAIDGGANTPRQIAKGCKAGTDCGSCVRRIQALLGEHGARPCPTARLAAKLGLADPEVQADPAPEARGAAPIAPVAPVAPVVPLRVA